MKRYKFLMLAAIFAITPMLTSCELLEGMFEDNPVETPSTPPASVIPVAENSLQVDNNTIVTQAEAE